MGAAERSFARRWRHESGAIMGCHRRTTSAGKPFSPPITVDERPKTDIQDIATQAGSNLTAIASDESHGNVFVAGFGDGVVRLFDKRMDDASNVVMRVWRQHHTWIQSVHLQRGGNQELITGR
jgi:hypothetical protein